MIGLDARYYQTIHKERRSSQTKTSIALSNFFKSFIQLIRGFFTSTPKLTPERISVNTLPEKPIETSANEEAYTPTGVSIDLSDSNFEPVAAEQYFQARNSHLLIRNRFVILVTRGRIDPYAKGWSRLYEADTIKASMEAQQNTCWWKQ